MAKEDYGGTLNKSVSLLSEEKKRNWDRKVQTDFMS